MENKSQKCNLIWFNLLKIRQIVSESFLSVRSDMGYYFTRSREGEDWTFRIHFMFGIEMSSTDDGDGYWIPAPHVPGHWSSDSGQFVTLSPLTWSRLMTSHSSGALTTRHARRKTQTKVNIMLRRQSCVQSSLPPTPRLLFTLGEEKANDVQIELRAEPTSRSQKIER